MTCHRVLLLALFFSSAAFGQSLSENDPSIEGNPPKLDVGIVTCDDGSRWHGFVFQTIAGLPYVVESGDDLVGWTKVDTFYGLGQEQVVLMKQAPPLPPSSPSPSGPITPHPIVVRVPNAQVIMRRAIGGGTILSWRSLDDSSSRTHFFPTLIQDVGWNSMPGYVRQLSGYNFLICNPLVPQTPPTEFPTLGSKDTAMVAAFEASFADMNADAAAAIARRRTTPTVPAPPLEKRFWRVRVNWSLDSDLDGTPDWMEFAQMFAEGAGNNPVAGPGADPFNLDVNNDGIADGGQRSSDGDDVMDDVDADKSDPLINWHKCPDYRYALFQISTGSAQAGWPLSIDNFGEVLFQNGQWSGGGYVSLGEGVYALMGNDRGSILGIAPTEDGYSNLLSWATVSTAPQEVATGPYFAAGFIQTNSQPINGGGLIGTGGWGNYTMDGSFIAQSVAIELDGNGDRPQHRSKWNINPITLAVTETQVEDGTLSTDDSGFTWGYDYESNTSPYATFLKSPTGQKETWNSDEFSHVTTMSSGITLVSGGEISSILTGQKKGTLKLKHQGFWQSPRHVKEATDAAPEGIIIKQGDFPVWMNGRQYGIPTIAPGYTGNPAIQPMDISRNGCILGLDPGVSCDPFFISGLPFHLESDQDGTYGKSFGVDNVSVGSEQSGAAHDRQWIMVPEGSTPSILIHSAASLSHPLKLSATGVKLNGNEETTIGIPVEPVTVSATTGAATGQEVDLEIKLQSGQASLSKPIGLKLMKHRIVEVAVWSIDSELTSPAVPAKDDDPGRPAIIYTMVPTFNPTKVQIEDYLKAIYFPQVNVEFNVTIKPTHVQVAWDKQNADGSVANQMLDRELNPSSEQQAILDVAKDQNADINVYWVGGKFPIVGPESSAKGTSNPNKRERNVWLVGNPYRTSLTLDEMLHTMAHEIAHVMMGEANVGHPDKLETPGPAPLPGTQVMDRLLCSGDGAILGSRPKILVKGEWDMMEDWMKEQIDKKLLGN